MVKDNPALKVKATEIFEKDPESITSEDRGVIVKYYRDLREHWAHSETEKAKKKADKQREKDVKEGKIIASQEELENSTLD
jgi:hypothetical protein